MSREEIRQTLCELRKLAKTGTAEITKEEIIDMCDTLLSMYRPRKGAKK